MLSLPKSTEIKRQLPKNTIYAKFNMNTKAREKFDRDISKIFIINEVSTSTTTIAKGDKIESFFVLLVSLKQKEFDEKNLILISKLIPQNIVFFLECNDMYKLAIYRIKLMQTDWKPCELHKINLVGLNFDTVWENLIKTVEDGVWSEELSLDENIMLHERQAKLQNEIERLEKLARAEIQPKKKFELVLEIKKIEEQLKNENAYC